MEGGDTTTATTTTSTTTATGVSGDKTTDIRIINDDDLRHIVYTSSRGSNGERLYSSQSYNCWSCVFVLGQLKCRY